MEAEAAAEGAPAGATAPPAGTSVGAAAVQGAACLLEVVAGHGAGIDRRVHPRAHVLMLMPIPPPPSTSIAAEAAASPPHRPLKRLRGQEEEDDDHEVGSIVIHAGRRWWIVLSCRRLSTHPGVLSFAFSIPPTQPPNESRPSSHRHRCRPATSARSGSGHTAARPAASRRARWPAARPTRRRCARIPLPTLALDMACKLHADSNRPPIRSQHAIDGVHGSAGPLLACTHQPVHRRAAPLW